MGNVSTLLFSARDGNIGSMNTYGANVLVCSVVKGKTKAPVEEEDEEEELRKLQAEMAM